MPGVLDDGEPLSVRRTAETYESARVLGVDRVEFLGYVDSGMVGTPTSEAPWSFAQTPVDQAAARLAVILGEEQADVLTTYDDNGGYGHPDHIQVHRVGARAAELVGLEQVFQNTINRTALIEGIEAMRRLAARGHRAPRLLGAAGLRQAGRGDHPPGRRRATSPGSKRASMQAHRSQISETDFFLTMPDEMFARAFGTEWYIADGPAPAEGSLAARAVRARSADAPATPGSWTHTGYTQQIVFGPGSLRELTGLLRTLGLRRVLLVTTAGRHDSDDGDRVRAAIGRALASTFAEVESHVPVPLVQRAVQQARRDGVDGVVSFGGGSCADLAKAVCFFIEQEMGTPGASFADRPGAAARVGADDVLGRRAHPVLRHDRPGHPPEERRRAGRRSRRSPRSTTRSSRCRRRRGSAPRPA